MKRSSIAGGALAVLLLAAAGPVNAQVDGAETEAETGHLSDEEAQAAYEAYAAEVLKDLTAEHGEVALRGAPVTLHIPASFDFYDSAESRTILEDLWGNPPDETVLGMMFPAGVSPAVSDWGAVLTYEDTGYVSDKDAATINYADLLKELKEGTRQSNAQREQLGFATVELRGWAEAPRYEADSHRLYWAKDLVFSDSDGASTLNYDMRLLGRGGVLSINFIGGIEALESVRAAAPDVLASARFNPGQTYADYQPGDKTAGYGVAALIAGGAGAAVLKKTGLLAIALAFLKKGWILIPIMLGGAWQVVRRMFGRKAGS